MFLIAFYIPYQWTGLNVPIYIITAFHEEFFSELKELDDNEISYELLKKPVDRENLIALAKSILFEPQLMD